MYICNATFQICCPMSHLMYHYPVFLILLQNVLVLLYTIYKRQYKMKIVAAFQGMHVSHSYAWLPKKCDYRTDRGTDRQIIFMCRYALQATQKLIFHAHLPVAYRFWLVITQSLLLVNVHSIKYLIFQTLYMFDNALMGNRQYNEKINTTNLEILHCWGLLCPVIKHRLQTIL